MTLPLGDVELANERELLTELLDRNEVMTPTRAGGHYKLSLVVWESVKPKAAP